MTRPSLLVGFSAILAALAPGQTTADAPGPWRLHEAARLPDWLRVSGELRVRYESLDERLVAGQNGENHGVFTRILFLMSVQDEFLEATAELIDARIYGQPDDAFPTTGQVDAVELLQGYVAGRFTDAFAPNDSLRVQLGRHTMDVGSRRFIARNLYRNSINAFTGLNAQWESSEGTFVRAFYTHPNVRLPADGEFDRLANNEVEFNEARASRRFWGIFAEFPAAFARTNVELFYYGLLESDARDLITRDRDLDTFGARLKRPPRRGTVDWEFEAAYQVGKSRLRLSDPTRQDHEAGFVHLGAGYTFDAPTIPRLEAVFDFASGDNDPNDGQNGRFDSLFGVPRGDFGPTGLFRPVTRSNLVSPGVRFTMKASDRWELMLLQRFNYLAADRDFWTTTAVVDPDGRSGDHIGNLSEMRLRYHPYGAKSLRLEVGVGFHDAGSFSERAPNGDGEDALYGYVQSLFWF